MALFTSGRTNVTVENTIQNKDEFEQLMIACEVAEMNDEEREKFCEAGGLGEYLVTEAKLKNRTLVRLSKKDDLKRRKKMAAYQLAKEKNDPAWKKFTFHRAKALEYENKMFAKYGGKAERVAKETQKSYLKGDKAGLLDKFGAKDR
ncbi:MAG: hypothetical protein PHC62_00245 [Candidatus Izemoplasmatales bacterium]|nr:hypothetical protein [Candidatus Izemoplasmatales bacterium]